MNQPSTPLRRVMIAGALAGALVLGACSSGSDDKGTPSETTVTGDVDRTAVTTTIADTVIVPAQETLAATTAELATAMTAMCDTPSQATGEAARTAWIEASEAWDRTAAFRIGPIDSLRSKAKISYPTDVVKVANVATGPEPAEVTPAAVAELGADQRGLRAIEQLIFSVPADGNVPDRQCRYAESASTLVAEGAAELRDAWVTGIDGDAPWSEQFATGSGGFDDVTDSIAAIVNGSLMAVDDVIKMHLEPTLGEDGAAPDAVAGDGEAAHNGIGQSLATIESARAVFLGSTADEAAEASIATLLGSDDEAATTYLDALTTASEALGTIPELALIDPTATDSPEMTAVRTAREALDTARTTMRTQIASQLGVTVTFSESDGDG